MSALGILRSFAEARCADHEPIPARLTYGTIREALRLIEGRGYQTGSLAGALELTPGYRISIPLTHVDGPEERELLRRRHPPHPDIPRNLIAQGWFESGYDTAALEFWDVVHEANRELAARDAEISSLRDQLRRVEGERDEAQRQCGELHEHLALMVRYLEEEASEGDGIAEQHWDGYQGAKSVLMRTAPNRAAWEGADERRG